MQWQDEYKQGLKAYRNGFGWGLLLGLVGCLAIGKAIYSLPILLGLLMGALAFRLKIREIEKKERND